MLPSPAPCMKGVDEMISVSRLNGTPFVINALLIETIEATPDTVISLTNGKKYVIRESVQEVIDLVRQFYRDIYVLKYFSQNEIGGSNVSE